MNWFYDFLHVFLPLAAVCFFLIFVLWFLFILEVRQKKAELQKLKRKFAWGFQSRLNSDWRQWLRGKEQIYLLVIPTGSTKKNFLLGDDVEARLKTAQQWVEQKKLPLKSVIFCCVGGCGKITRYNGKMYPFEAQVMAIDLFAKEAPLVFWASNSCLTVGNFVQDFKPLFQLLNRFFVKCENIEVIIISEQEHNRRIQLTYRRLFGLGNVQFVSTRYPLPQKERLLKEPLLTLLTFIDPISVDFPYWRILEKHRLEEREKQLRSFSCLLWKKYQTLIGR